MNSEQEEETQPPKKLLNTDLEDLDKKPTSEGKNLMEKDEKNIKNVKGYINRIKKDQCDKNLR